CNVKSIQLLPNVLAKERAVRAGAFEAVFVRDGRVTEGASTNLFAVLGGTLRTHTADHHGLPGITRQILIEEAEQLGVAVVESAVTPKDLANAEEVFVTSTSADVMPVVRVDGRPIGVGEPGPVAQRLHAALRASATPVRAVPYGPRRRAHPGPGGSDAVHQLHRRGAACRVARRRRPPPAVRGPPRTPPT